MKIKKLLRKRIKELEWNLWEIEHPEQFETGEIVIYDPFITCTLEENEEETSKPATIIKFLGIRHSKYETDYGYSHYWYRAYIIKCEDEYIECLDSNLTKITKT